MKTKYILPLLLMMVVFSACGGAVSNCGCEAANCEGAVSNVDGTAPDNAGIVSNDGNAVSGDDGAVSNTDGAASDDAGVVSDYWGEWIKDVPHGAFEQADSETFAWEQNGYSVEIEIEKWTAARGSSEYIMHPASDEIPLPLLQPSDCVIPFVLTAKTTTKDSDFTTSFNFNANTFSVGGYTYPRLSGCELSRFEDTVENMTKNFDSFTESNTKEYRQEHIPYYHRMLWAGIGGHFSDTKPGDEQVFLGCYVINDYYSPEFPNGNLELFPAGSAVMRVAVSGDPAQRSEQIELVMH